MSLPRGWTIAELGSISTKIGSGATPRGGQSSYATVGIPLIRSMNVHFGGFEHEGLAYLNDAQAQALEGVTVRPNDILLNITGASIGRVCLAPDTMSGGRVNQHVCIVRLVEELLPTYVEKFLASSEMQRWILEENYGFTRQALTKGMIEQLAIPLPPAPEQRRIVAKLDALFARLACARAELIRVRDLAEHARMRARASAFSGELTRPDRKGQDADWSDRKLGDVADVVTGSTPPTAEKERYFGGEVPFFKPTDLDAGYFVETPRETLTADGAKRSRVVPAGSTLVTCIGATIAKAGFARVACAFNQQINAAIPRAELVDAKWLYWATISPQFRSAIIANSSATTMPIINKGRFQSLRLRIPPLWEQEIIVERLEGIHTRADRLEAEAARARALLDRLEAAILTKAFKGELVPQDPNDEPASVLLQRIRAQRAAVRPVEKGRRRVPSQAPG